MYIRIILIPIVIVLFLFGSLPQVVAGGKELKVPLPDLAPPLSSDQCRCESLINASVYADTLSQKNIVGTLSKGTDEINTSQITTDGNYGLGVWPGVYDLQYDILEFFVQNFFIKLISLDIVSDLQDVVNQLAGYPSDNITFTVNISGDQEIQVHSEEEPGTVKVSGIDLTKVSSLPVGTNEWFYNSTEQKVYIKVSLVYQQRLRQLQLLLQQ